MSRIWIDAGHGGKDSGAIGSKSYEKDHALRIAKQLKKDLESLGHNVGMSRTTDRYLTLTRRTNLANAWGADYFVSVHMNASNDKSAHGYEIFTHTNAGARTNDFGLMVHNALSGAYGLRNRGRKKANFAVLRQTKMSAILIEYAFVTNKSDENVLLKNWKGLSKLTAKGIHTATGGKVDAIAPTPKPTPPKPPVKKPKPPKESRSKYKEVKGSWTGQTLVKYMKGKPVRDLQNMLSNVHYYPNKSAKNNGVDDYFGSDTENAVYRYQSMHGLAYDGKAGKEVYGSLSGKKTASKKTSYKVGSTVTLKKSARNFATGQSILNSAKGKRYKIIQVKSDRVLLDNIMSWVKRSDVY